MADLEGRIDYKIGKVSWAAIQEGRDMHVLPVDDETGLILPSHTLDEACICGVEIEPNSRFSNFVIIHRMLN